MAIEADAGQLRQTRGFSGRRSFLLLGALLLALPSWYSPSPSSSVGTRARAESSRAPRRTPSRSATRSPGGPLSSEELDKLPGSPLAVVRRKDGKGFVVLRQRGARPKSFNAFSGDLSKALDKRVPDFQKRSSKVIEISAGKAFFFSYIRKTKGTVHTVVVVPDGKRSYVLNTVSRGGVRGRRTPGRAHHPVLQGLGQAAAYRRELVEPLEDDRQVAQEAR